MSTRRKFLRSAAAISLASMTRLTRSQAVTSPLASDPRRPLFHLLPAANWMNDPNGPIYFEGQYHLFYQFNPKGAIWGNMSWNHAISADMLHWRNAPVAFKPSADGPDAAGCFSGSCIAVEEGKRKRVYALYTGVVKSVARETIRNEGLQESQCLAWSDDPRLRTWIKQPVPVLTAPPAGLHVTGFRDPAVWKQNGTYYMTVGSGIERSGGCVLLYRSSDLRHWDYLHVLTSGTWSNQYTSNPVADGEMWECPDFFPLDGGHVLIYSTQGKVYWQSGKLDEQKMTFVPQKQGLLDLDAFYAPKTQVDASGRRILWGWIPERRSEAEMVEAGWSGMMSLPRLLNLRADGLLRLSALPETTSLRGEPLGGTSRRRVIAAATGEFTCTGERAKPFHLQALAGTNPLLSAAYDASTHTVLIDGHEVPLEEGDVPALHAWVDGSVLEVLIAERIGYTKRFYYQASLAPDIQLTLEGQGATLAAWSLRPISSDRLTTVV